MTDYALGSSTEEARRLVRQAHYLEPHTRRTLQAAGVGPGTRVLDLGAGMGDVSLIAADLGASVVAVERDAETLERARARLATREIELVHGTVPDVAVTGQFDVICGRLILMYLAEPAVVLRQLAARFLRPAATIAFIEYDFRVARAVPAPALIRKSIETICRIFEGVGCQTDLGLRLPSVYAAAGFAVPSLDAMLWTASAKDDVAYDMIPAVLQSLSPIAHRIGLASEIDPELGTLGNRLHAASQAEGTLVGPLVVGAVARVAS